jgi:hypothetical protein
MVAIKNSKKGYQRTKGVAVLYEYQQDRKSDATKEVVG